MFADPDELGPISKITLAKYENKYMYVFLAVARILEFSLENFLLYKSKNRQT